MNQEYTNLIILVVIIVIIISALIPMLWSHYQNSRSNNHSVDNTTPYRDKLLHIKHPIISQLYDHYSQVMIGQNHIFIWLMWCRLAGGHCLLTGLPGTGKTQAVKTFVSLLWLDMGRVQGTSDLLPADITGSLIYNPKTSEFDTVFGPIMHECVLVDEINRMPSKTQSALLQAMAEWYIVIGQNTYDLPQSFMIIATQNPHDRIGTFLLPQAQLDRFMCEVVVGAPGLEEQEQILNQLNQNKIAEKLPLDKEGSRRLGDLQSEYNQITISSSITTSVAQLIQDQWLSSRAGQHIIAFARALALMDNRQHVDQSDITVALNYTIEHRLK